MKTGVKLLAVAIGITTLTGLLAVGCGTVRAAYESAPYQVLRRDGKIELREYPALAVAETPMRGDNDSFMRLFRFISGQNAAQQKISMTTPVFFSGYTTNEMMAFVLPKKLAADQAPKPNEAKVSIREVTGGKFAVLRFRGGRNSKNQSAALEKLQAWLAKENFKAAGGPIYAYFDPPWTPTFFRRNEVMLRLAATP